MTNHMVKMYLKQYRSVWSGFIWIRLGNIMWSCERDNEPLVSIKKGISLPDEKIVAFEKGPHFMENGNVSI